MNAALQALIHNCIIGGMKRRKGSEMGGKKRSVTFGSSFTKHFRKIVYLGVLGCGSYCEIKGPNRRYYTKPKQKLEHVIHWATNRTGRISLLYVRLMFRAWPPSCILFFFICSDLEHANNERY